MASSQNQRSWADCHTGWRASQCCGAAHAPEAMTVCVPKEMPPAEIEQKLNAANLTGAGPWWKVSADKTYQRGEPHPSPCKDDRERLHYLLLEAVDRQPSGRGSSFLGHPARSVSAGIAVYELRLRFTCGCNLLAMRHGRWIPTPRSHLGDKIPSKSVMASLEKSRK
jgi:hypothetical protein